MAPCARAPGRAPARAGAPAQDRTFRAPSPSPPAAPPPLLRRVSCGHTPISKPRLNSSPRAIVIAFAMTATAASPDADTSTQP